MISGIVHMLRSGARWRDCPAAYGPYTTVYNRFNRWSRQGVWHAMFEALTGHSGLYGSAAIDATHIKAHRKRRPSPIVISGSSWFCVLRFSTIAREVSALSRDVVGA